MKWKPTWILLALAVALFAFIHFVERKQRSPGAGGTPPAVLSIRSAEVTAIQIRRTNQLILRVDRTNQTWSLTTPLFYPAQNFAIERLLHTLADLGPGTFISLDELNAARRSIAEYGLDVPAVVLTLQNGGRRTEIRFGSRTPVGDQVYAQFDDAPGVYTVNAEIFDRLPQSANDWRDNSLLSLVGMQLDRLEMRAPGKGFAVQVNPTNKLYYLSKPTPARADKAKVEALLRKVQLETVQKFVTDDPRAELDAYGLQPPEAELVFGLGTNDALVVQFGKSPSNDLVFARRLAHTNIVLVSKGLLEALQISPADLRDRRLLAFAPAAVDAIDAMGEEKFSVRRQTNGTWQVTEPQPSSADATLVREWLERLATLEGNIEKDVVTDFSTYGLAPPARQYWLRAGVTNGGGVLTNRVLAQLDLGRRDGAKVFARGSDDSVYSIALADHERLPAESWQLRDRRVFSFATNQVSRLGIRQRGYTRQMMRSAVGDWTLAPGSQGIINTFSLEEMMYRLGELRAAVWVAKGDQNRALYGFTDNGHKLTIELKSGEKPSMLTLEFGGFAPSQFPYALATVDGQSWVFEFPLQFYFQLVRDLSNPPPRPP